MEAYFDNSATTPVYPEVRDLVVKLMEQDYGNPSSLHQKGVDAARYVSDARDKIARLLKVQAKEIVFTSGGTESNNMALIGGALANRRAGNKIITTAVEHASVGSPLTFLEDMGFDVVRIPTGNDGVVDVDRLVDEVDDDTIIVSVMYVNNEIGAVMPVEDIARRIKEKNPSVLFHVDAIQAFGKYVIYPKRMGIDMMSISSHKFHGPKGVGVLYANKKVPLTNIIEGGAQERGKRAGTENLPGIVGMAVALKDAVSNIEKSSAKVTTLRDRLIEGLSKIEHSVLNGASENRLPGNVNFCFEGIEGESLLLLLDAKGIAASSGSACTSGSLDPSHVLLAIGRPHEVAHGSLRLTIAEDITEEQIDYMVKEIKNVVDYLRSISPVWDELQRGEQKHVI